MNTLDPLSSDYDLLLEDALNQDLLFSALQDDLPGQTGRGGTITMAKYPAGRSCGIG